MGRFYEYFYLTIHVQLCNCGCIKNVNIILLNYFLMPKLYKMYLVWDLNPYLKYYKVMTYLC